MAGDVFAGVSHAQARDYLFFSYTTLTTTGYGNLVPAGDIGQILSVFEMLTGQVFLVTLVAGRARQSLRVPGVLVRLARRDPHHSPERLTIYEVDRQADGARVWAQRARDAAPESSPAVLADGQRRRTISTARIDGAVAGTPFFIALVPAYIAFLRQEVRFHLRVAALYGHDPADPHVAADFLVLRGVHKDPEQALAELEVVRATPLPPAGERTPLRSWYEATVRILILAGFLSAPEEDEETGQLTRWEKVMRAVRLVVAGLIWALTWVVPLRS